MTIPPLDLENLHKVIQEMDTGDADTFNLVWLQGNGGPQPVLWPMRTSPPMQGNLSNPNDGTMIAFSPRGDH